MQKIKSICPQEIILQDQKDKIICQRIKAING